MRASIDGVQQALAERSYLADRGLATTVHLALKLGKPVLLEGVTRPAAPIATFLAGVTLGQAGGDPAALEAALAQIRRAIPS